MVLGMLHDIIFCPPVRLHHQLSNPKFHTDSPCYCTNAQIKSQLDNTAIPVYTVPLPEVTKTDGQLHVSQPGDITKEVPITPTSSPFADLAEAAGPLAQIAGVAGPVAVDIPVPQVRLVRSAHPGQ